MLRLIEIGQKEGYAKAVREIVADLRGLHWTHRDAEPAKRLAGMIEAEFGGDNGQRHKD